MKHLKKAYIKISSRIAVGNFQNEFLQKNQNAFRIINARHCWTNSDLLRRWIVNRSSHQRYSVRKGVLRNFAKFTGEHLCQSLKFCEISKNTFFTEHLWASASVDK